MTGQAPTPQLQSPDSQYFQLPPSLYPQFQIPDFLFSSKVSSKYHLKCWSQIDLRLIDSMQFRKTFSSTFDSAFSFYFFESLPLSSVIQSSLSLSQTQYLSAQLS